MKIPTLGAGGPFASTVGQTQGLAQQAQAANLLGPYVGGIGR